MKRSAECLRDEKSQKDEDDDFQSNLEVLIYPQLFIDGLFFSRDILGCYITTFSLEGLTDWSFFTKRQKSLFMYGCLFGNLRHQEVVSILCEVEGCNPNMSLKEICGVSSNLTPFLKACFDGYIETVKYFLNEGFVFAHHPFQSEYGINAIEKISKLHPEIIEYFSFFDHEIQRLANLAMTINDGTVTDKNLLDIKDFYDSISNDAIFLEIFSQKEKYKDFTSQEIGSKIQELSEAFENMGEVLISGGIFENSGSSCC
ncbi:MAG: hypothetical protein KA998_05105 [Rickettsiaceae bacterium]|nr:hypothetical protein [Rickettsiaceae bacterium]